MEKKVISVALGLTYSSAMTSQRRIFVWGSNGYGQLGDGTEVAKFTPTEITGYINLVPGEVIIDVSLGREHTSIYTTNNSIFTWGQNYSGQLGNGTIINGSSPKEGPTNGPIILAVESIQYGESMVAYAPKNKDIHLMDGILTWN